MNQLTAIFKALSDGNRLRVVFALMTHPELCACQLTELIGVSGATASRHLGVLIASGLVDSRKDGRWVYYRLCREQAETAGLLAWLEAQRCAAPEAAADKKRLTKIIAAKPEDLCRKQRGEKCCPK